ncbi:MAG: PASTA domain-containing protein [Corynebacteriales bacterium]|nr:PASTA domain-containing protein [Mycobacteriales bacterium]
MSLDDLMGPQPATQPAPPTSVGRKLGRVLTLALCGLVAGIVVAASAFPAVGITGLTAKAASDSFQNLPNDLAKPFIPQTSKLYDANGNYITSFYDENRTNIKIDQVPKIMQDAMVAAEDQRFYEHRGVDPNGILRAALANKSAGGTKQGASTLTQQYVKMVLQYSAKTKEEREKATAPTAARKIREIRYAIAVEKELDKKQILEHYLNMAFFGNRAHGIWSASKAYFNKEPKDLTLGEAALLAGLVQSPTEYNPAVGDGKAAKERRNYVLDRMLDQEFITKKQAEAAEKEDIVLNPQSEPRKCENAPDKERYGFYCSYFVEWWKENPAFGKTARERLQKLERGGYHITTAYNPEVNDAAQAAVDKQVSRENRFMVGVVLIEPPTGRVVGMANNRTFSIEENAGGKKYPNTTIPLLTGTESSPGYQAGSTFKMFSMLSALEHGLPLSYKRNSPQKYASRFPNGGGGATACSRGGRAVYCPSNYPGAPQGDQTMWSGFGQSINTYFIQLEEATNVGPVVEMSERMGVKLRGEDGKAIKANPESFASFTLGTAQVMPIDMASAYATLANRGVYCEPTPLKAILDSNGKPQPYANPNCKKAIEPDIADAATDAARCPVGQTAHGDCGKAVTAASVGSELQRPVAGKTGTTDNNNAAWFVGYTPDLAAAAVKVNPDRPSENVGDTNDPIQVFKDTMKTALANTPPTEFVPPTEGRINGDQSGIPNVTGATPEDAKSQLEAAGFRAKVNPDQVSSEQPAGRVAHTTPGADQDAPRGSTVEIFISNGKKPSDESEPTNPDSGGGSAPRHGEPPGQSRRGR